MGDWTVAIGPRVIRKQRKCRGVARNASLRIGSIEHAASDLNLACRNGEGAGAPARTPPHCDTPARTSADGAPSIDTFPDRRYDHRRGAPAERYPMRLRLFGGFTILELLVVITVILLLTALSVQAVIRARGEARKARCVSNLRSIGSALSVYCNTHDGLLPSNLPDFMPGYAGESRHTVRIGAGVKQGLGRLIPRYLSDARMLGCVGHSLHQPDAVGEAWSGMASVDSAYLYRETDRGARRRLDANGQTIGMVIDNDTTSPAVGSAHGGRWVNILYSDGHVAGHPNPSVDGSHPGHPRTYTHDSQPETVDLVWDATDAN
jgi:prepilin-type processing-associated H-X9-DG protein